MWLNELNANSNQYILLEKTHNSCLYRQWYSSKQQGTVIIGRTKIVMFAQQLISNVNSAVSC